MNRLADAVSPYLRSHASNPVDWYPWGEEAFAAARDRDVPVLVSIGYATCHWCHVMARESFSDPALAAVLNERFVAIKVDREEHPEVDSAYLAAAGAFTRQLGWPLNVFTTPEGKAFFGGTYSPPVPVDGHPSFGQLLDAVTEAWRDRRAEVLDTAGRLAQAIAESTSAGPGSGAGPGSPIDVPAGDETVDALRKALAAAADRLAATEDTTYGGFGDAPKFPSSPALAFLLSQPEGAGGARALALRTLRQMAASDLRDPVEGGFFRYSTRRDWTDPHYERMLYDNAQLLELYLAAWKQSREGWAREAAEGVASFLTTVLQLPSGGFASAQDSESDIDGVRTEGGYYALEAGARALQPAPALDEKVLTGWNGLAIAALARAGFTLDRPTFIAAAERAADHLLEAHCANGPEALVRASVNGRLSPAPATLEDFGMFAEGLLALAAVTGSLRHAEAGRMLVDAVLDAGFRAPGGGDPVLGGRGLSIELDPSEGAYPSGTSATASAAVLLFELTADRRYRDAARAALAPHTAFAVQQPIAFGATLALLTRLSEPGEELVLVEPSPASATGGEALREAVRMHGAALVSRVTEPQAAALAAAGFELYEGRTTQRGLPTAYLCRDFVCRLPATTAHELDARA
jgi:uncharacterized protein YyaL (SSP411 family)